MDGLVRVGDLVGGKFLSTFQAHTTNCYQAAWSPHTESAWATVGTDGLLKIWDLKSASKTIATVKASDG
jgi:WD40 repeat protein